MTSKATVVKALVFTGAIVTYGSLISQGPVKVNTIENPFRHGPQRARRP